MTKIRVWTGMVILLLAIGLQGVAQFTLSGQLRTRTEFRDGVGTLRPKAYSPSFFTSQRTRLTFNYKMSHVIFQTSVQDVRVWGQDASTISNADGNKLSVHEAWAQVELLNRWDSSFRRSAIDYLAVKIGRQELIYDDARLLGNLDWLQQSRRHDAIVFKLKQRDWQVDLGLAFNQNSDAFNYNGTYYTPANTLPYIKDSRGNLAVTPAAYIPLVGSNGWSAKNGTPALQGMTSSNGLYQQYKALQFLYVAKTFNKTKISGLFLADQFGKYINDSVKNIAGTDTGYIYGNHFNQKGVNSRYTGGLHVTSWLDDRNRFALTAGFYYQFGKDRDGQQLSAYNPELSVSFTDGLFTYTAGWDYLSGNNSFSNSTTNHRFDPLYGTPHAFWGAMDYFYVSTGSPTGGLNNPFAKVKYNSRGTRFSAGIDYHYFSLAKNQKDFRGNAVNKNLGSEIDVTADYALTKITNVQVGASLMAATNSMEYAKNISPGTAKRTGVWTYLMISIKPEFLFK
ncbi:MAG: alginate export family protein [Chitinophagaceae bacterium]